MAHKNIPIFIPHLGCPNQCVFCNQRSISGCQSFDESGVARQIEASLSTLPMGSDAEIAFFGGSFTGIDRGQMVRLLKLAQRYVEQGLVQSIRLSTRPDYINDEILSILSRYAVKTIELGLQSMDDEVLLACRRGHTAEQARDACRAIVKAGFSLVGQMMIGLPGATLDTELQTAEAICSLGAVAARIYPTVVFYDTPLCEMAKKQDYIALTVEEAVRRSAAVLRIFCAHDVPCIRIGLCASESLTSEAAVFAGPNHPALGELIWNEYYYGQLLSAVDAAGMRGQAIDLVLPQREVSKVIGQRRGNLIRLKRETGTCVYKAVGQEKQNGIRVVPYQRKKNIRGILPCI